MKACWLLVAALGLTATSWGGEPDASLFDFKGIRLGSRVAELEKTGRYTCRESLNRTLADRQCTLGAGETETVAGAPVRSMTLSYYDDRLSRMSILFQAADFSRVLGALRERYGAEVALEQEVFETRDNVRYDNATATWRKGASRMFVRRYYMDTETSALTYEADSAAPEFSRRRDAEQRKGARDL